jgi:glutaredoxin
MESMYEGIEFETVNDDGKCECDLVMFALSTCAHCRRAKAFLQESGLKYRYVYLDLIDYTRKQKLKKDLQKKHETRVAFPFLVIDDEKSVVGFIKPEYEKLV